MRSSCCMLGNHSDGRVVDLSSIPLPVCEVIEDARGGCGSVGAPEQARFLMLFVDCSIHYPVAGRKDIE